MKSSVLIDTINLNTQEDEAWGWREAQWLGALAAFTGDSGSIPSTHMVIHTF